MLDDADTNPLTFEVNVPFRPEWRNVELLRTSVLNCLATMFENYDFCEQLSMTTAELLENSIGYGMWNQEDCPPLRLVVVGDTEEVAVEVSNPVRDGEDLSRLLQTVRSIEEAESPRAAYSARLLEIADDPAMSGSRLGLLRIAFETGAQLSAEVAENRRSVRVRAIIRAGHHKAA